MIALEPVTGSNPSKPPAMAENVPCFICRRRASGIGVQAQKPGEGSFQGSNVRWVCEDCDVKMARRAVCNPRALEACERKAVDMTVDELGSFIMEVLGGKTDLREMEAFERNSIVVHVINSFGKSIRSIADDDIIPF